MKKIQFFEFFIFDFWASPLASMIGYDLLNY